MIIKIHYLREDKLFHFICLKFFRIYYYYFLCLTFYYIKRYNRISHTHAITITWNDVSHVSDKFFYCIIYCRILKYNHSHGLQISKDCLILVELSEPFFMDQKTVCLFRTIFSFLKGKYYFA